MMYNLHMYLKSFWELQSIGITFLFGAVILFVLRRQVTVSIRDILFNIMYVLPMSYMALIFWMRVTNVTPVSAPPGSLMGFIYLMFWLIAVPQRAFVYFLGHSFLLSALATGLNLSKRDRALLGIGLALLATMVGQRFWLETVIKDRMFGYERMIYRDGALVGNYMIINDKTRGRSLNDDKRKRNTWRAIDLFNSLLNQEKYDEAVRMASVFYERKDLINLHFFRGMTNNAYIKMLYRRGDLKGAIIARRQSLGRGNYAANNIVVELWLLQDEYRKKVGDQEFFSDPAISSEKGVIDLATQQLWLDELRERESGSKYEYEKHEYLGDYYYGTLHFDLAEQEYLNALASLDNLKYDLKPRDLERELWELKDSLLHLCAIQSKYDDAIRMAQDLAKLRHPKYGDNYAETIKTLKIAKENNLHPKHLFFENLTALQGGVHERGEFTRFHTPEMRSLAYTERQYSEELRWRKQDARKKSSRASSLVLVGVPNADEFAKKIDTSGEFESLSPDDFTSEKFRQKYADAIRKMNKRQFSEAVAIFESLLDYAESNAEKAVIYNRLSQAFKELNEFHKQLDAIKLYKKYAWNEDRLKEAEKRRSEHSPAACCPIP